MPCMPRQTKRLCLSRPEIVHLSPDGAYSRIAGEELFPKQNAALLWSTRNSPPMSSKMPDSRGDATRAKVRDANPPRLKDAPRAIARTLVYAGLIAASIVLWWAFGRLVLG